LPGKFNPEILTGSLKRGHQTKVGWEKISDFLVLSFNISKTAGDTANVTISD